MPFLFFIVACTASTEEGSPRESGAESAESAAETGCAVDNWYLDVDGDGQGDPAIGIESCDPGAGWSTVALDCDDSNPWIYRDAEEFCDGLDNDCDRTVDGANIVSWESGGRWELVPWWDFGEADGYGLAVDRDGDVWICPGTYPLTVAVGSSATVGIHGRYGSAVTELMSSNAAVTAAEGTNVTVEGLTLWGNAYVASLVVDAGAGVAAADVVLAENPRGVGLSVGEGATFVGSAVVVRDNGVDPATPIGLVETAAGSSVSFVDSLFARNMAEYAALRLGGAATFVDCTFEDNTGVSGGALTALAGAEVLIETSSFSGNIAGDGGAVYVGGGLTASDVVFEGNTASGDGGAVHVAEGGSVELARTSMSGNSAESQGGAVAVLGGRLSDVDGDYARNTAVVGGAVYVSEGGEMTFTGTTSSGNPGAVGGWGGAGDLREGVAGANDVLG